jgi:hypothetical protein
MNQRVTQGVSPRNRLSRTLDGDGEAITARVRPARAERRRVCAQCARGVRFWVAGDEPRARAGRDEPFVLDVDLAHRYLDAPRLDAILRRTVDSTWLVKRQHPTSPRAWFVELPGERIIQEICAVHLDERLLKIHYGGNDAGPIHLSQPPRYTSAELDAVGLDDATISEWLAAAFDDLPPQRVGYS